MYRLLNQFIFYLSDTQQYSFYSILENSDLFRVFIRYKWLIENLCAIRRPNSNFLIAQLHSMSLDVPQLSLL